MGERFTREMAAIFAARGKAALGRLPTDLVTEAIESFEPERQALLHRLREGS
jgi:hypothetical protein